jgi:hypothetical protein
MRYAEEVELLLEEMRRVLAFLEWDRDRWEKRALHVHQSRADSITDSPTPLPAQGKTAAFEEGLRAYALRQASVRQRLFNTFAQQWHDVPAFIASIDRELADE